MRNNSLLQWHINLLELFNTKSNLLGEDKGVHTFPNSICVKVNKIAELEFELAYYDSVVQRFNHYTTNIPPPKDSFNLHKIIPAIKLSHLVAKEIH